MDDKCSVCCYEIPDFEKVTVIKRDSDEESVFSDVCGFCLSKILSNLN